MNILLGNIGRMNSDDIGKHKNIDTKTDITKTHSIMIYWIKAYDAGAET